MHSVQADRRDVVDVVYSWPGEATRRGLRLDLAFVERAPERIRVSTPEELAFDLVVIGILEPRSPDEFQEADANGIRWLPARAWLEG